MKSKIAIAVAIGCMFANGASAAIVNLGAGSFTPAASVITFSEQAYGTVNPVYSVAGNTISFGTNFAGQTVAGSTVKTLIGAPTTATALSLVTVTGGTFIQNDGSNPSSPVLSGSPMFNGPISILFANPVAAVGLDGGYFNTIGATTIEAYDEVGNILGSITNSKLGIEFYGLFDTDGSNIAGISFYITGNEPAGFAIDNVTFGDASVINRTPEPASVALLGLGLVGLGLSRRKRV